MNKQESFWIFVNLGLGDAIVCNALFRHYAEVHKDKYVILPQWHHNIATIQWMLSDVPNIFFYPIETEQQLLMCRDSLERSDCLELGFYKKTRMEVNSSGRMEFSEATFNPVLWDSEFYRQAGLDPELKWKGFKLPEFYKLPHPPYYPMVVYHEDKERGFGFRDEFIKNLPRLGDMKCLSKENRLEDSCRLIDSATEIHCIDSSMLNLADLMETPYCKRFVFHKYARKGLPPKLKKNWEIID